LDDHEPVLPDRTIHLGTGPPGLRFEIDHIRRMAIAADGVDDLPGITGVRLGYIIVKRCAADNGSFGGVAPPGKHARERYSYCEQQPRASFHDKSPRHVDENKTI